MGTAGSLQMTLPPSVQGSETAEPCESVPTECGSAVQACVKGSRRRTGMTARLERERRDMETSWGRESEKPICTLIARAGRDASGKWPARTPHVSRTRAVRGDPV